MKHNNISVPSQTHALPRKQIFALGLLSLLPLIILKSEFDKLYWFGDEWDLLNEVSLHGFVPWISQVFAENFVPLFKLLWGGLVFVGNGDYNLMIYTLWATHYIVVCFLGLVLRGAGFSSFSILLAIAMMGLSSSHIETLAWSVQWSAILSMLFFLIALFLYTKPAREEATLNATQRVYQCALSAASALCFSRGVLSGPAIAAYTLLTKPSTLIREWKSRSIDLAVLFIPAVIVAGVIAKNSTGNHANELNAETITGMVQFGSAYFFLNPFTQFFYLSDSVGHAIAGATKVSAIIIGLLLATGTQRKLLGTLLLLDLGNSFLLGLGRYHTGFEASLSLRYQYASIACTAPFFAIAIEQIIARIIPNRPKVFRYLTQVSATTILIVIAVWKWSEYTHWFSGWRGSEPRVTLQMDPEKLPEHAIPGNPFLTTERGLELKSEFNLH